MENLVIIRSPWWPKWTLHSLYDKLKSAWTLRMTQMSLPLWILPCQPNVSIHWHSCCHFWKHSYIPTMTKISIPLCIWCNTSIHGSIFNLIIVHWHPGTIPSPFQVWCFHPPLHTNYFWKHDYIPVVKEIRLPLLILYSATISGIESDPMRVCAHPRNIPSPFLVRYFPTSMQIISRNMIMYQLRKKYAYHYYFCIQQLSLAVYQIQWQSVHLSEIFLVHCQSNSPCRVFLETWLCTSCERNTLTIILYTTIITGSVSEAMTVCSPSGTIPSPFLVWCSHPFRQIISRNMIIYQLWSKWAFHY